MGGSFGLWWHNHSKSVGGEFLPQGIPQIRCQLFSLGKSPERTLPDFCLRQDIGLLHTVCQHSRKGAGVWSMALPIFTFWVASHPTPCCFYISFTQRTTERPGYWEWGKDPYNPMWTHPHLLLPDRYPCHLLALASCVSLVNWLDPHWSQLYPQSHCYSFLHSRLFVSSKMYWNSLPMMSPFLFPLVFASLLLFLNWNFT